MKLTIGDNSVKQKVCGQIHHKYVAFKISPHIAHTSNNSHMIYSAKSKSTLYGSWLAGFFCTFSYPCFCAKPYFQPINSNKLIIGV